MKIVGLAILLSGRGGVKLKAFKMSGLGPLSAQMRSGADDHDSIGSSFRECIVRDMQREPGFPGTGRGDS